MNKFSLIIIAIVALAASFFTYKEYYKKEPALGIATYQMIVWTKPTTDAQWAEDVKKESLNFRTDKQLTDLLVSQQNKFDTVATKNYTQATQYPDSIRWELMEQGIIEPDLTNTLNQRIKNYKWEYEKISQSIERIAKEVDLRSKNKVDRSNDILSINPTTDEERAEIVKIKKAKGL